MLMFDDFEGVKREVEELKQARDQAKGAYKELLRNIRREFKCKNLKEARRLSEKLQGNVRDTAEEWTTAFKAFKKQWGHKLKNLKRK